MSDYFSIAEMTDNNLAVRMGIDNTPSLAILENLGATVSGLEKVRALFGLPLHVNSGYRCEELEMIYSERDYQIWYLRKALHNEDTSWSCYLADKAHPKGYAADFTCAQFGTPEEVIHAIANSNIQFDQCILEGNWVHISFDPRMRRQLLTREFTTFGHQV